MIVVVNRVGYVVPDKFVSGLRRKFAGKRCQARGLSLTHARSYLVYRLAPWGRHVIEYQHVPAQGDMVPSRYQAETVANRLAERLVSRWVRDGYLERCGFGRYRKVQS